MNVLEQERSTYPRVSDIISKQNDKEFRGIALEVLANACVRGATIHEYCTTYLKDLWVMDMVPEYIPYFDAFKTWKEANVTQVISTGVRLYDDRRKFSGEFDILVELTNGQRALIDIKTSSSKSKSWPIQLAAYHHLCAIAGYEVERVFNLHLKVKTPATWETNEGGKILVSPPSVIVKEIDCEDIIKYWDIFSSALKCYDYFDRKEEKNVSV